MAYSWIPFYKELSQKLLKFRNDRQPLIDWIYSNIKSEYIKHLKDDPDGRRVADIDPFTVYAIFNRGIAHDKRIEICQLFKNYLGVSAPVPKVTMFAVGNAAELYPGSTLRGCEPLAVRHSLGVYLSL